MLDNKLKSIEIVFENTDFVTILAEDIIEFYANDIIKRISKVNDDNLLEMEIARHIGIVLKPSADKEYFEFGQVDEQFKNTVFMRIQAHRDIAAIQINMVDSDGNEDKYYYYSTWDDEDDYSNSAQHLILYVDGSIGIFIAKEWEEPAIEELNGEVYDYY